MNNKVFYFLFTFSVSHQKSIERHKQNRGPLIKALLHGTTSGQTLHRVPLRGTFIQSKQ